MIAYQLGAMQAMATYAGLPVTRLKPLGAHNTMAAVRADYALAIGRATKTVDPSVIYVALSGSEMEKAGRGLGLRVAREGFATASMTRRAVSSRGSCRARCSRTRPWWRIRSCAWC